jgi:hypothetical protein
MATAANHYVLDGIGILGTIDTTSFGGGPLVSLEVDGIKVQDAELEQTARGFEVSGIVSAVPDDRTVSVTVLVPAVNISASESVTFSGLAVVTTALQSFAPGLLTGALHEYAARPVAGTAQVVESLAPRQPGC